MSQTRASELEGYLKRIGQNIMNMYAKLNELDGKIADLEAKFDNVKGELASASSVVSELKENNFKKDEFDEFVNKLTDGLKELIPEAPSEAQEAAPQL